MEDFPVLEFTAEDLREWWLKLFGSELPLLRTRALDGEISECPFRGACWMVYFGLLSDESASGWPDQIAKSREDYVAEKKKFTLDPSQIPTDADLTRINPLSQDEQNPWKVYFEDRELEKTILQDVERTFPDHEFFRDSQTQKILANILFVWSKGNPEISYRQGMHELLALILYVVDTDATSVANLLGAHDEVNQEIDEMMAKIASKAYIEHDSFSIFQKLMKVIKSWFESNQRQGEEDLKSSSLPKQTIPDGTKLFRQESAGIEEEITQTQSEIIQKCHKIHHVLLKAYDPTLHAHLAKLGIEPQIYGLRWIRILFAREFSISEVLILWDAIFAEDPNLGIVDYICVSMLISLRDILLQSDFSECLSRLMRFPEVDSLEVFQKALKIRGGTLNAQRADTALPIAYNHKNPLQLPKEKKSSFVRKMKKTFAPKASSPAYSTPPQTRKTADELIEEQTQILVERERKLQLELNHVLQMNVILSEKIRKEVRGLQQELRREGSPNLASIYLAIAELKQVGDILSGDLPFDMGLLNSNEGFQATNPEVELEFDDIEGLEAKERQKRELEEFRRKEEERKKAEEKKREEEKKRREQEEERRKEELEQRKQIRKPKIQDQSQNLFEEADEDFDLFKSKEPINNKLQALLD